MKRLDDTLRILAAVVFAFLCLVSAAFAFSDETASASDTVEETVAPVTYEYEIIITAPRGWYADAADLKITIRDVNGTGWNSAVLVCPGTGGTVKIEESSTTVAVSENGRYIVRVTDPNGEEHEASETVECFDTAAPSVTAGIRDKVLHCEASDGQSGIYGIMVDGNLYTTLHDGALDLRLEDYSSAGKTLSVTAIDNVGNRSPMTTIDNPYYSDATPAPSATNAPVIIYTGTQDSGTSGTGTSQSSGTGTAAMPAQVNTGTAAGASVSSFVSTPTPAPTAAPTPVPDVAEAEEITIEPGTGFSENGNSVTRDLLYDKHTNKQFVTVQTRQGNTFYLVIDYDKVSDEDEEQYQTYFLNPVDEADLLALLDDDAISALTSSGEAVAETPAVCTCSEKCEIGRIDTTCPVCRTNMSECLGIVTVTPTPEPTEAPEETDDGSEKSGGNGMGGVLVVLLILGLVGGGIVYFLKNKKSKPTTSGDTEFDEYDFGEDEEDDVEEVSEDEEVSAHDRTYRHD